MTQAQLWIAAAACAIVAGLAGLGEWARGRRRNLDNPGWVPWTLIQVLAMTIAVVLAALAILKGR
jgi:hypothetical protein